MRPEASSDARWQEPEDRAAEHGLAAAGLAHQGDDLAALENERHVLEDGEPTRAEREPLEPQERHGPVLLRGHASGWLRGSSRSRSASPSRFTPSTLSTIARPGASSSQAASCM